MKSHEAPVTESMQQCIDYIKQNEDEIAEYVNSLFLAQKDVIREQLLESLAAMLTPFPLIMNGAAMIARMIILVNCTKMERYLWSRLLVNFSRANILVQAAQPMYLTMVYHITHMGIVSRTTPLRLAAPL